LNQSGYHIRYLNDALCITERSFYYRQRIPYERSTYVRHSNTSSEMTNMRICIPSDRRVIPFETARRHARFRVPVHTRSYVSVYFVGEIDANDR